MDIYKKSEIKMTKRFSVILILCLLVIPTILAININIKTLPSHRISIIIREAGKLTSLESFHKDTGDGNVLLTSSVDKSEIDLIVTLKKDGVNILNEKFESISTAKPINIDFVPESVELILGELEPVVNETNETEENLTETAGTTVNVNVEVTNESEENETIEESAPTTETQTEEVDAKKGKITGAVIEGTKAVFTSKTTYYVIGGIFILGVLFFAVFIARKKLKFKSGHYINFRVGNTNETKISTGHDKRLAEAEKKLEEARKDLDEIKNRKSKLEEVRKRFEQDKKELDKLERGY